MGKTGADIILCFLGLITGGSIGAETALSPTDCPAIVTQGTATAFTAHPFFAHGISGRKGCRERRSVRHSGAARDHAGLYERAADPCRTGERQGADQPKQDARYFIADVFVRVGVSTTLVAAAAQTLGRRRLVEIRNQILETRCRVPEINRDAENAQLEAEREVHTTRWR